MKKYYFYIALMLFGLNGNLSAQDAKLHLRDFTPRFTVGEFNVSGTCSLCTRRILNALKVEGVKSAFWDKDEQQLTVQYEEKKISLQKIHWLLAAAGHDTSSLKAEDEIYAKLPACCHYNRTKQSVAL